MVPGAYHSSLAQQQFRAGNYSAATLYGAEALVDAVLGAATLGASTRLGAGVRAVETVAPAATEGVRAGRTLYHYTDEAGLNAILNEQKLNPSLKALRPRDVRYGNGQYLTDIEPGATSAKELSKALVNNPHQVDKFSHYLEIDPAGLNVIEGRPGVHVIPNEVPLDLNNRILSHGKVPYR
ncbi:hypothetical protein F8237_25825 [Bradyrhizobium betae]|uniref:Tox-ART-HYD1 domain-containing protein n=2 Tax=Bradyrhizobium betae TaxID=244734 RepID=A0A5P6PGB6_9BRAD|nr:hypothetical protein F8237_25825 [Bradyrhizobium betae]